MKRKQRDDGLRSDTAILGRVVRKDLSDEETFESRSEGRWNYAVPGEEHFMKRKQPTQRP